MLSNGISPCLKSLDFQLIVLIVLVVIIVLCNYFEDFCIIVKQSNPELLTNISSILIPFLLFSASYPAFKREEVELLAQSIISAYINATQKDQLPTEWTISQGIYFSATIITTIGKFSTTIPRQTIRKQQPVAPILIHNYSFIIWL